MQCRAGCSVPRLLYRHCLPGRSSSMHERPSFRSGDYHVQVPVDGDAAPWRGRGFDGQCGDGAAASRTRQPQARVRRGRHPHLDQAGPVRLCRRRRRALDRRPQDRLRRGRNWRSLVASETIVETQTTRRLGPPKLRRSHEKVIARDAFSSGSLPRRGRAALAYHLQANKIACFTSSDAEPSAQEIGATAITTRDWESSMDRRTLLKGLAGVGSLAATGGGSMAALSHGAATRTLRFVPQANRADFDPVWGTQYVVRNAAAMGWDTPYGIEATLQPQRQMVASEELAAAGLI